MRYLLFLPFFCFATTTTPLSLGLFTGYQEESLKWRVDDEGVSVYSEDYTHLNSMVIGTDISKIYRDLAVLGRFSYSFIGRGVLNQNSSNPPFLYQDTFSFSTSANAFIFEGGVGYFVNLTPDRHYTGFVLPYFGYFYNSGSIWSHPLNGDSFLPEGLCIEWKGLSLGAFGGFIPNKLYAFSAGYSYQFLTLSLKDQVTQIKNNSIQQSSLSLSSRGNSGHFGFLEIKRTLPQITLSFLAKLRYYTACRFTQLISGDQSLPVQLNLRQTTIVLSLNLYRKF